MSIDKLSDDRLEDLLLQFKYRQAVSRVARGVTHSYNNIFTGLGGQLAILRQEGGLPAEGPAARRTTIIDDLLQRGIDHTAVLYDFIRGADDGDCHPHSPLLIANKAMQLLNSISRVHRFALHSDIGQEKLQCNLRDLALVLFYLGENCVDATPEGGDIEVAIVRQHENSGTGGIAFSFRDHGPGFAEIVLSALFRPFVSTREGSQRGLGLYAAELLSRRNRGRIAVVQHGPGNTVVSAIFPAADEERTDWEMNKAREPLGQQPADRVGKQCILVVEDDEGMRSLLVYRLQRQGHMVFCVDTCAEALEEYEQLHDIITIILMDIGLRDTNGFACLRELMKIDNEARIIFMSGHNEAVPAELAGHAFLHKPFTLDQLGKAIQDFHDYKTSGQECSGAGRR